MAAGGRQRGTKHRPSAFPPDPPPGIQGGFNPLVIIGGMDETLKVAPPLIHELSDFQGLCSLRSITTVPMEERTRHRSLMRYGHQAVKLSNGVFAISGGISADEPLSREEQVAIVSFKPVFSCHFPATAFDSRLMVGHAMTRLPTEPAFLLISGGGLTAFSFGSAFDVKPLVLTSDPTITTVPLAPPSKQPVNLFLEPRPTPVPRLEPTRANWQRALFDLTPVVFQGCSLGPCLRNWTVRYIAERCGSRKVSIHLSKSDSNLSWHDRNFSYTMTTTSDLLDRAFGVTGSTGETVYLRSLSQGAPRPANLRADFPEIAEDFQLPEFCRPGVEAGLFSSPLRISSKDMG
jgi:tRNA wybutosine-synthesizing protein 4